jgi:programmed cell death protein 5
MENELDQIRKKRLAQVQDGDEGDQAQAQGAMANAQEEQYQAQRQMILRKVLTPEARMRLSNIRMAKPDVVQNLEDQLIQLAASGRIGVVDDAMLKKLLQKVMPTKREIKIERR